MNRFLAILLTVLSLVLAASCSLRPLPERMDTFVTQVEKHSASYTQQDWEAANEKFEALCEEYQQKKGSLTMDQIKQVRSAMARYMAVAVRSGVDSISSTLEEIGEEIPGLIQELREAVPGLLQSLDGFLQGLGSSLGLSDQETAPAE